MNKKNTLLTLIFSICSLFIFGQKEVYKINKQNCRESENIEYCQTHLKMNEYLSNPQNLKDHLAYETEIKSYIQNFKSEKKGGATEKGTIYKIPVVFHILHNNGIENISRTQILDQLAILNKDYRKLNADTADVVAQFKGIIADVGIEFVLANRDPIGRAFGGITRTIDPITTSGGVANESTQLNAIKTKNDIFQGEWAGNKYLNVFVCANVGSTAAGYTRYPSNNISMNNGIWILHNYVGSIGTSSINTSRTLTHEVGHWLNLAHTWGSTNNPGVACGDDGVSDTPITKGYQTCILNNAIDCTNGVTENIENFMEYSYCNKMFTEGQKARMIAALNSSQGGRNNIWLSANLNSVAPLIYADIQSDKTIICAGQSVNLSDKAYSQATSWSWKTNGGSPSTSTSKNPTITYSTPGFYSINLTSSASGSGSTATDTKTKYIQVLPISSSFPYYESFLNYNQLDDINKWAQYDQGGNRKFQIYTGVGFSDDKCVKLANFDETLISTVDELNSEIIDLSIVPTSSPITLTFKYAYRKKIDTNNESLKIAVSTDCGTTWLVRNTISGNYLSTLTSSSSWTPQSINDWTTVHVTQITSQFYKSNFRFKFQFTGSGGNNLYLDDINIYNGTPSSTVVLGINENPFELSNFELFPNPTESELNVHFDIPSDKEVLFDIQDLTGKIIKTEKINGILGSNLVVLNTDDLAHGIYLLKTQIGSIQKISQFIVK